MNDNETVERHPEERHPDFVLVGPKPGPTISESITMAMINRDFKFEYSILSTQLGRRLTTKDSEYWQLSDRYKAAVNSLVIDVRQDLASVVVKQERKQAKVAELASKPVNSCKVCNLPIPPTGKRGRPATMHKECRPSL